MKKLILSAILAGVAFTQGFAHRDLYGIYVRISPQSFYCAMISTKLCARISDPDKPDDDNPWRTQFRCYNPEGQLIDEFMADGYKLSESPEGTRVEYVLP